MPYDLKRPHPPGCVGKRWAIVRTLLSQFAKFGVVGVAATVIDFGVMNLLHYGLYIDLLIANSCGFIISLVFNYLASMRYVFCHREGMSRAREFAIFLVLSVIGLGLNDAIVIALAEAAGLGANIAKVCATALVMVYNFVTRKIFLDGTGSDGPAGTGAGADA